MKKNELVLTIIFFMTMLIVLMMPGVLPAFGVSGNVTYFNVTVTVNGGSPIITYVQAISDSPSEGTTKTVHFYFNATHPNGVANILPGGASIKITQSGTTLTSTGCMVNSTDGVTLNRFDCNVTLNYYNLPGAWTINATIVDTSANSVSNTGSSFTNGMIYGLTLKATTITFGGDSGTPDISAGQNPQQVNNTGNMNFTQINLTAFNVKSITNAIIGAGNFTANTTNGTGFGQILINNTAVMLVNSTLPVNGSRNVYLYLDLPSGVANGTYYSEDQWRVTVGG
jgi:hypothetical protein